MPLESRAFADVERRIHEHLYETVRPDHGAHVVSRGAVWTHGRANRDSAVPDYLRGDEPDPEDVGVPVLFGEAEPLRQVRSDHVTVEHCHLPSLLHQQVREHLGRGGLAGPAEAGEPDADALPMPWRVAFGEYVGDLRPGEPAGQGATLAQVLLTHLRPRDRGRLRAFGQRRDLLVPVLAGDVHQLLEGHGLDAGLLAEPVHDLLGVVRAVERLARRVDTGTGVVPADDQVVGAVVGAV